MIKPELLYGKLAQKYQILIFEDLAKCAKSHGHIYRLFRDHQKAHYGPNERFIFYTGSQVGSKTKDLLRHAADQFDISRCFINVFCAGHDQDSLSSDDVQLINLPVESADFDENNLLDVNTICALPWMHLEVMNPGSIKVCCFAQSSVSHTKKSNDLRDTFHSIDIQNLRDDLLQGKKTSHCKVCWISESLGMQSLRQWRNKLHGQEFFTDYIDRPRLISVAFRPSTVCNFKCRICDESSSSQWAQENLAHAPDPAAKSRTLQMIDMIKWAKKDEKFMENFVTLVPELEFVDIYGGEPLLLTEFEAVIQKSISNGVAKKQRLHFNTNGSVFPRHLIDQMRQFKYVDVCLSIDDIGTRFELQRGGKWQDIEHNIDQFIQCRSNNFHVSLLCTVSNLNLLYLDQLLGFAESKGIGVTFNRLHDPDYLRFDRITVDLQHKVVEKYQNHSNITLSNIARDLIKANLGDVAEWKHHMRTLDQRRKQDLSESHSELCALMGYNH